MKSIHISNEMIEHFKTCAKEKNFRAFYDEYINFIFKLSESLKMVSIDKTPHSFIVKHLRDFFLYLGHVDVNHRGSYIRGSYGLEKGPGLEICADIKNTVITENWNSFFEKYQNIADSIIDVARNQNILDLCIELGDECYPNFSSREKARKGSDTNIHHQRQPGHSQKKYKVFKSVPQRAFYPDTCSRCVDKHTMIGPFSWTGFASYANYTPTYANHTDERSVLSSSTPNNESSSSDPGSHDIISPYSDVSVFEFDRTVFDSNQLFHLLRKSFADNNLTESNKTQDTSPIEDVSLCQDTEGISNRSDSLTEVLDDTLRNQGDESFSDNNEKSCNEQVSGESVTDSSSSFESGSSTATQLNSDVSTSRNETTVDESNKKSNSQLLSISNQLNQLLSLLKKRAESHFEDLHDKDTEKNTSDVNINESTNTETQSSNCDTVQLNASNLPISVYEEHQNDEKSRSNGCKILSNINQNGFAHEDHSKMFAEPIVTESNNTQNTLLIDKYSLCQDTEDTLKRSDSFEKLKMPDGILKNQADKSQSENGEFQNENAEMTFVDQQMLNLNPPDQQTTQFDQTIEALLESYKNELTLLAPSDTVVQNQERLTREIREFEEINGEIEQLSAEPNSETISSTKLIVPEETPEEQVSDSGDDNLNDPEFEEKLREQEERHRQEWEALMKKRKSKR